MQVWLDLEDTVINNWFDAELMFNNILKIKKYLEQHKITKVGIFSFAIDNDQDVEQFVNSGLKETLEMYLGSVSIPVTVSSIATVSEILEISNNPNIGSINQFKQTISKSKAFEQFIKHKMGLVSNHQVLIDDLVDNNTLHSDGLIITTININNCWNI